MPLVLPLPHCPSKRKGIKASHVAAEVLISRLAESSKAHKGHILSTHAQHRLHQSGAYIIAE